MNTKRCLRCRKVLRADEHSCNRCGYVFSQALAKHNGNATNGSHLSATVSYPSNPPASQHRAGHYSGFHPEDQPFQSSFMPVQRPPAITRRLVEQESDEILLQPVATTSSSVPQLTPVTEQPTPKQLPRRYVATPVPSPLPMPQRYAGVLAQTSTMVPEPEFFPPPLPLESKLHEQITEPLPEPVHLSGKRKPHNRIVLVLLLASCILFLLATSILAFLFFGQKPVASSQPVLIAAPGVLRVNDSFLLSGSSFQANEPVSLTRDANIPLEDSAGKPYYAQADARGNFAVQITITDKWVIGMHSIYAADNIHPHAFTTITVQQAPKTPPKLLLPANQIDFGAGVPGAITTKTISLSNAGGGQVFWRAGSDSTWLTISPEDGSFSGSAIITLTVNRDKLSPQSYTGYITFYQNENNNTPVTLKATMVVSPFAANLNVSAASLTFNGSATQNPAIQTITVQNTGGRALDWTASTGTSTSGNWLNVSTVSGHLEPNTQQYISVSVHSVGLAVGSYQERLTFSYSGSGPAIQVLVTLNVGPSPLPAMVVNSTSLIFSAIQGTDPAPQAFTITNSGNAVLNWALTEDTNAAKIATVSPSNGSLGPGQSATVTVKPNVAQVPAGVITGIITISDTDKGTPVKSQQVAVKVTISNQAVIKVSSSNLTFNNTGSTASPSQVLTITNSGSATLNWALSQSLPPWLSVDIPSGTLAPGASAFVTATCDSTGLSASPQPYTLVVSDTDAHTQVVAQNVQVTLTVT
jgi:hypothetical protein